MTVHLFTPAGMTRPTPYHHVAMGTGARHVHVAGQVARDADGNPVATGDLAGQVAHVLRATATGLAGAGATFDDVVRLTFYVTAWEPDMIDAFMRGVDGVAAEIGLPQPMPPASLIGVAALFEPDVLVELEATAVVDEPGDSDLRLRALSDERDIADLMTGWIHRDTGNWDALRALFHPGADIALSWFTGPAEDFVTASAGMSASALRTKHLVAAPTITFSDSRRRAVAETNAVVVAESRDLELGATTHTRFVDRLEFLDGRWGIVHRDAVYDFSGFAFPLGSDVEVDRTAVRRHPVEYAALAYLLEAGGFAVHGPFPVRGSDGEREIRAAAAAWLADDV